MGKNEKTGLLSGYELVTVTGSNLQRVSDAKPRLFGLDDYIKPDLVLQLQVLKEHLGIKSFKTI
jgi:hypothetical protein